MTKVCKALNVFSVTSLLVLPLVAGSTSLGCAVIRLVVVHGGAPNVLSHEAKADIASPRLLPAFPFIWISLYALWDPFVRTSGFLSIFLRCRRLLLLVGKKQRDRQGRTRNKRDHVVLFMF